MLGARRHTVDTTLWFCQTRCVKQRVALIEFPVYNQIPLVSGYLQAFASTHDSGSPGKERLVNPSNPTIPWDVCESPNTTPGVLARRNTEVYQAWVSLGMTLALTSHSVASSSADEATVTARTTPMAYFLKLVVDEFNVFHSSHQHDERRNRDGRHAYGPPQIWAPCPRRGRTLDLGGPT